MLLVLFALAVALIFSNVLFDAIGAMIYLPALTIGAALSALLLRNVINRDTTDADADSGYTARRGGGLGIATARCGQKIEILAYFLGACLIASALVRLIAALALVACERKSPAPRVPTAFPFQEDRWREAEDSRSRDSASRQGGGEIPEDGEPLPRDRASASEWCAR